MDFLKKNKITILYLLILIVYAMVILLTGFNHEPWADEAQAFIHARDYSVTELLFEKLKYEGHPIVWYLIIKFFLLFKVFSSQAIYENLFILTCILHIFAVYLFLFKSKIPLCIKLLLPFTFFIVYQYPVVARNHSLVFPFLAVIATFFYKNRIKTPYIYSILLIILANISAYTFVLACVLFMFFVYDIWKENKIQLTKYIPIFVTGLSIFFTTLYLNKPVDCTFAAEINLKSFTIMNFLDNLHSNFFNYKTELLYMFELYVIVFFFFSTAKIFCRNKYQLSLFFAINISLFIVQTVFYTNDWHCGYSILFLIFSMWIFTDENNKEKITLKKYLVFMITAIILLLSQLSWGVKSIIFDIKESYCASKSVSEYIKKEYLYEKDIATLGFKSVALHPYFEKNIFYNLDEKFLASWKKDVIENNLENIKKKPPEILIYPKNDESQYSYLSNGYVERIEYCGYLYSKGDIKENNCFLIYKMNPNNL